MNVCVVLRQNLIDREDSNFRRQRIFIDRTNPLDYLREEDIIQKYRLNRVAIFYLIDSLKDYLDPPTRRSHAIPVHVQVLTALNYLSTGSFHRVVGDSQDIWLSQSSVTRIVNRFNKGVVSLLKDNFINFPVTE